MKKRPNILTIAGFDPSGGAGILADIKTFEKNACQGFAVQTANTSQTEDEFFWIDWVGPDRIMAQLNDQLARYSFDVVKIGLIASMDVLNEVIQTLKRKGCQKIIWDPILKSSSGFEFHNTVQYSEKILNNLFMITPNWEEILKLGNGMDAVEDARHLANYCKVYLKGGHREELKGKDLLFDGEKEFSFNPKPGKYFPKHGSGCVFSAALASNLARGYSLNKAILRSKRYVEFYLKSTPTLLGVHQN